MWWCTPGIPELGTDTGALQARGEAGLCREIVFQREMGSGNYSYVPPHPTHTTADDGFQAVASLTLLQVSSIDQLLI